MTTLLCDRPSIQHVVLSLRLKPLAALRPGVPATVRISDTVDALVVQLAQFGLELDDGHDGAHVQPLRLST